jgi:hypothetical protein
MRRKSLFDAGRWLRSRGPNAHFGVDAVKHRSEGDSLRRLLRSRSQLEFCSSIERSPIAAALTPTLKVKQTWLEEFGIAAQTSIKEVRKYYHQTLTPSGCLTL